MLYLVTMSFDDPSSSTVLLCSTSTSFMDSCTILGTVLMGSWYHLVCLLHRQQSLQRKVHALIVGWGTLFVHVDHVVLFISLMQISGSLILLLLELFTLQLHMFVSFWSLYNFFVLDSFFSLLGGSFPIRFFSFSLFVRDFILLMGTSSGLVFGTHIILVCLCLLPPSLA